MKNSLMNKIGEWLLNQRIVEEVSERNMAIDHIKSMSNPLNEHLFKLYIFQKSQYRTRWENEIKNFLDDISDEVWGKKENRFEEEDYFKWLFYRKFHNDDEIINIKRKFISILNQYPNETILKNWKDIEFYNVCERFYKLICPMLEIGKIKDEQFDKIIEIFEIE